MKHEWHTADEAGPPVNPSVAADRWFSPGRFALVLAAFVVAAYPEVVLGIRTFVFRDFGYFGYPLAHYHCERFWQGEIPLWNPLSNCGLPFLAQWNTMTLYPGSLFNLLLPPSWSLGVFCLLHQWWSGLGMYCLARKWTGHRLGACVAGVAFTFNGVTLNSLIWPNNIAALGWMPWVVLLVEQGWRSGGRKLILACIVAAIQMLAGAPEIILLTWLMLALLALLMFVEAGAERLALARRFGLVIVIVAGLASAQLLPFLDLLRHSQRDEHFYESAWGMPPTGWANLFVPLFRCFPTSQGVYFQWGQYWTTSYYPGVGVVALAILAVCRTRDRRVWFLGGFALLGLVLALGDHGHLYGWLKKIVPQIGFMRYPIKLVVWTVFAVPLLSAYAIRLAQRPDRSAATVGKGDFLLGALLTLLIGGLVWFARLYPVALEDWRTTAVSGISRAGYLWGILALCVLARRVKRLTFRVSAGLCLLATVGLDGLTFAPGQQLTVPGTVLVPRVAQIDPRPRHGESRAMITFSAHQRFNTVSTSDLMNDFLVKRSGLFANCNLLENIPKVDGFYSLYLYEADSVWSLLYYQTNVSQLAAILFSTNQLYYGGLLDFLGVSQTSMPDRYFDWIQRTNFMPLASIGQACVFADEQTTLRALVAPGFDPRRTVYLPNDASGRLSETNANTSRIHRARFDAESAEIEVVADQPSVLVVAQSFYHPWRASVDGEPTRIWRANQAFQAIQIPAGRRTVRLRYRDWMFVSGVVVSCASGLFCAVVLWRSMKGKSEARVGKPGLR